MRRTELADHPLVGPINPAGVIIPSQRQKRCVCEADCLVGGLHRGVSVGTQTLQSHIVIAPVLP